MTRLFLIFSVLAFGLGTAQAQTVPPGSKVLIATADTAPATNAYFSFTDLATMTNGYQVPNTKTFTTSSVCIANSCTATIAGCGAIIGTATAAFTNGQTALPTGLFTFTSVTPSGSANMATIYAEKFSSLVCYDIPFTFNQNLYPLIRTQPSSQGIVLLIGVES